MALLGKAVVAIWNDITPEGRENFIEWHNRQHMPERVGIPGFLRGRRYLAEYGTPEYYTLYEAADAAVLTGKDYLDRLNNPTPWTKQSVTDFRNTVRGVCPLAYSNGAGDGGFILTARFDPAPKDRAQLEAAIIAQLKKIDEMKGVSGVHLCVADTAASGIETRERKGRQVGVPNWIIMVEGSTAAAVDAAGLVLSRDLAAKDEIGPIEKGLYHLENSISSAAPSA